jgi:hypothetical protein
MLPVRSAKQGLVFNVLLQPRASRNQVVGLQGEALKIQLTAPPVKGKANKALLEFLAKKLGVSKSQLRIIAGHTSRDKQIGVSGVAKEDIQRLVDL